VDCLVSIPRWSQGESTRGRATAATLKCLSISNSYTIVAIVDGERICFADHRVNAKGESILRQKDQLLSSLLECIFSTNSLP
jgi:hypothetical protein